MTDITLIATASFLAAAAATLVLAAVAAPQRDVRRRARELLLQLFHGRQRR